MSLLIGLFAPSARAALILKAIPSQSSIPLNGTVTYSLSLSNNGVVQIQTVQVAAGFPTDATIVSAVNNFSSGRLTTNSGAVIFNVDTLTAGANATFTLQLRPARQGTFTAGFAAQGTGEVQVSTNVVITVASSQADLGVQVTGFPTNVVVGDAFGYSVTVTNLGPSVANGVNIQSALPAGMIFLDVTPTIPSSFVNQTLLLTPGTVTNGVGTNYIVRVQPSAAGDYKIVTSVSTTQNADTAVANNTVTNSLTVSGFVTNRVAILSVSPQVFNRQTGLMDQVVIVSNLTSTAISSVRIQATNLAGANYLYNASGTNAGQPYVLLAAPLEPTNIASVTLQFFMPSRTPIDVGLVAVEGPNLNALQVPNGTVVLLDKNRIRILFNSLHYGSLFVEFPSTIGKTYWLAYKTTVDATNRVAALPPVVAKNTFTQLVDSSVPVIGDGARFYQVIEQ
jgi:uncharacterized repeat protein (TIGR01451 family)